MSKMVSERSWEQFRNTGLVFLVNTLLHTFGWAIVFEFDENENILRCFPARVKFRGFSEEVTTEAYKRISNYMIENAVVLLDEAFDD